MYVNERDSSAVTEAAQSVCQGGHYRDGMKCTKCPVNTIAPYKQEGDYDMCVDCAVGTVADENRYKCSKFR